MEEIAQAHANDLISKMREYQSNNVYCDVDISVEGKSFKCHRLVLGAACEYFNAMFNGSFKESMAEVITLEDTEAVTFEKVLQFIYSGSVSITDSNVLNLVRASEFYKLPRMEELCVQYIQRNIRALTGYVLKLFLFARATQKTKLVEFLTKYIYLHFDYFSKTTEFLEICSFDDINLILSLIGKATIPICQDVFLAGIFRWINHDSINCSSVTKKELFSQKLIGNINFGKLSSEFMKYFVLNESTNADNTAFSKEEINSTVVNKPDKVLHAYINRSSGNKPQFTSVFSLHKTVHGVRSTGTSNFVWTYSGEIDGALDSMRSVVLDNNLYSLNYSSGKNSFCMGSSIRLFSHTLLKSPPLILKDFDMCAQRNNIYVYNKQSLDKIIQYEENSTLTQEELAYGIYLFNVEVGNWLPLPPPQRKYNNSCMTCDEQRVYLIGGANSNNHVQAYDERTSKWITLDHTTGIYNSAACCVYNNKEIYVCGGSFNPRIMEIYDPVAGKWQVVDGNLLKGVWNHQLVEHIGCLFIFNQALSVEEHRSRINCFKPKNNTWYTCPSLYDAVMAYNDLIPKNSLTTLDAVIHYPYGI